MSSPKLVLHCGGQPAPYEQVAAVPVPQPTGTYCPVPHTELVELLKDRVDKETRMPLLSEQYGLNREGRQFFGVLQYQLDPEAETSVAFGLRNSYDKSMSIGVVRGLSVFVCDNLSFHGSSVQIVRKHTPNVWKDVKTAVIMSTMETERHAWGQRNWLERLKTRYCSLDDGFKSVGLALGRSVLTVTQASVALEEWRNIHLVPDYRHSQYRESAYALYQAMTHGAKLGSVECKVEEYCGVTGLVEAQFAVEMA